MALTLMLWPAPSAASTRVKPISPVLADAVIAHAFGAQDSRGRAGVDYPAIPLLAHHFPGRPRHVERTLQVHIHQGVEPIGGHVLKGRVADDSRVVDHDVHSAPGAQGGVDDRLLRLLDWSHCGYRQQPAPPCCRISSATAVAASAFEPSPVTDPPMSLTTTRAPRDGQQQRVLLAQAATGAGDHGNLLVEPQVVVSRPRSSPAHRKFFHAVDVGFFEPQLLRRYRQFQPG